MIKFTITSKNLKADGVRPYVGWSLHVDGFHARGSETMDPDLPKSQYEAHLRLLMLRRVQGGHPSFRSMTVDQENDFTEWAMGF